MKTPLFTIGYEQATQPSVVEAMAEAGVELLVDVRAVAASRRPGFSKRQLAAAVDERDIGYLHLRGLGTPADGRMAARRGDHGTMARIFAEHLKTEKAILELGELAELVRAGRRVCLLCFERNSEHCHRGILADLVCREVGAEQVDLYGTPV